MARFLFVYRRPTDSGPGMTPAETQQHLQHWQRWIAEGLQKGWMVDPGDALTAEGRVVGVRVVTDGPFVEAKEVVGGFSIIQADVLDSAAELARGCPCLRTGGTVEIRPLAGFQAHPAAQAR